MRDRDVLIMQLHVGGLDDCHHIRRRVLLGVINTREAILSARLALTSLEQLYSKFKEFMEILPGEQDYPGLRFMLGVERVNCRDEQDIMFAGRLAACGNIEFLTREAPQPSSLHELPHFKRAYDLIMRELME